uniref:Leuk-A4-hydro_C domain-containing protein n=1 Tax=Steinernema glaseri TaxID=37863 RepID=A0A1I7YVP7_9BILA
MENPCMIFLTPSLIAGDRSLTCLVAHEQIHAWFGNLVTNSSWEHQWLNEGFTTYMERCIGALMYGEAHRHFCGLNAWSSQLIPTVYEQFNPTHGLTKLVQTHSIEQDPNQAFSNIYYEKGQVFLFFLEKMFGVEEFYKYLRDYLKTFSRKSINSQQWKDHFVTFFQHKKEILDKIDFDLWMYSTGMPAIDPNYDDSFQKDCVEYCRKWAETKDDKVGEIGVETYKKFTPQQKEEFLHLLRQEEPLSTAKVEALTAKLHLENEHNCEIRHYWIRLCLKARWDPIVKIAHDYVLYYGRMKLVRYIYKDLFEWPQHAEETKKLFESNKPYMHAIAIRCIEHDMNAAAGAA